MLATITETEFKNEVRQLIKEYKLTGEKGEIFEHALHWIHYGHAGGELLESGVTIAEISSKVAEFVDVLTIGGAASESAIASAAAGGITWAVLGPVLSVFSGFGFAAMIALQIRDAVNLAYRYYGFYAMAYTITAWSFGYGIPQQSPAFLNLARQALYPKFDLGSYQRRWNEQSGLTRNKLETAAQKFGKPGKQALQSVLCGACSGDPKKLCVAILCGTAEKLPKGLERKGFIGYFSSPHNIVYPN